MPSAPASTLEALLVEHRPLKTTLVQALSLHRPASPSRALGTFPCGGTGTLTPRPPQSSASPIGPSSQFYSFDLLPSKWQSWPGQHGQSIPRFNSVFPDWVSGHCLSAHPNRYFNLVLQSQAACRAPACSPRTQCRSWLIGLCPQLPFPWRSSDHRRIQSSRALHPPPVGQADDRPHVQDAALPPVLGDQERHHSIREQHVWTRTTHCTPRLWMGIEPLGAPTSSSEKLPGSGNAGRSMSTSLTIRLHHSSACHSTPAP